MMSVRSSIELHLFLWRSRWAVLGALVVAVVATWHAIEPLTEATGFAAKARAAALPSAIWLLEVALFLHHWLHVRRERADLFFNPREDVPARFKSTVPRSGERIERLRDFVYSWRPEVNRAITANGVRFGLRADRFRPPELAMRLAPMVLAQELASGKVIFNDPKLRLCEDPDPSLLNALTPLAIQRTDYFSGLLTNQLTGRPIKRKEGALEFDGFAFVLEGAELLPLCESPCSNHIGVSTIAFLKSGRFLINTQTSGSRQSPELWAPSGSGSLDPVDLVGDGHTLVERGMERELLEECTDLRIEPTGAGSACRTKAIGFARMLHQGGKPEFFGVSRLHVDERHLKLRRGELMFIAESVRLRVGSAGGIDVADQIRKFRSTNASRLSCPLFLNLLFLEEWVRSSPDSFRDFAFS